MKLKDVLSRIRFSTNTTDDLSGKTVQSLFTNQSIIQQLKFALDKYASFTKALESTWSTQAWRTTALVTAPPQILRSKGLRFLFIYNKGLRYPLIEKDPNTIYANFYVQNIVGIPAWFLYFDNEIHLFPINNLEPSVSTILTALSPTDTQITLATDITLALKDGRVTIGNEKILYKYKTGTTLFQCTRGIEDTIAEEHNAGDTITENNVHMLYYKMHWSFDVPNSDKIDAVWANKEMEIHDQHIEVICDYVAYKLLMKIDRERAEAYKINFDEWLENAKYDIQKGRTDINKTDDVRDGFWFERQSNPYPMI
jgi:hypothetical protein